MVKFISALSVKYRFCGNVDLSDQSEKISDQSLLIMFHMIAGLGLDSVSPTPSLGLVLVSAPKSFGLGFDTLWSWSSLSWVKWS